MLSPSPAPPAPARPLATGSDVSIMISRLGRGGDWDGERWPAPRQGVLGPPRGCEGGCRSQGGGRPPALCFPCWPRLPHTPAPALHTCARTHVRTHAALPPDPLRCPSPGELLPQSQVAVPLSQCPQSSSPLLLGTGRAPAATAGSCLCWQRDGPARHGTARPTPQGGCACPGTGGSRCHTAAQSCCWNRGESSSVGSHTRVQSLPCAGTRVVCPGHAHAVRAGHRCPLHGSAAPHMPHCMSEPCGAEGT